MFMLMPHDVMTYVDTYVRPPSPAYAYALVDSEDWVICATVLFLIRSIHYFEEMSESNIFK